MRTSAVVRGVAASLLAALAAGEAHALTEHSWFTTNHEGVITNSAYWNNGNDWMTSTEDFARLWQSASGDYLFHLPTAEVNPAYLAFYQMADSVLTFDGEDEVFSSPALPDGQADRSSNPQPLAFFWRSGNFQSFSLSLSRGHLYSLSNVLWCVKTTFPGAASTTSPDIEMDFARGWFNFAGEDGTDASATLTMNGNADSLVCPRSMSVTVTNAVVSAPTFSWSGHATNTCLTVGRDGVLGVAGNFSFGVSADAKTCGTNRLVVSDGGRLSGAPSGAGLYQNAWKFGYDKGGVSRWNEIAFSGAGTDVDFSDVDSATFYGPTEFSVLGGASAFLSRATSFQPGEGKSASVTIDGEDTVVKVSKRKGDGDCGRLSTGKGSVELNIRGGVLKGDGPEGAEEMLLYLANDSDGTCVVNQTGGTVIHRPTGSSIRLAVGVTGSCAYNMSGGKLYIGSQGMQLGSSSPTKSQECSFNMTGGEVYNAGDCYFGSGSAYWTHYFRLNGGVYSGLRLLGGNGSFAARLVLEGDGGTFRAVGRADHATYSFIYGFSEAVVGARGLTIDTAGYTLRIRQAFADKTGESGVLRYVGSGQVLLNGTGSETTVSTISLSQTDLRPQSDLAGLGSTLVVTNSAILNLSQGAPAAFSLGGLVLGDAYSPGTLVVLPTTRLALGSFAAPGGVLSLSGTFDAATSYPLATVSGRLPASSADDWAQMAVNGNLPAGKIVRTTSSYDEVQDVTTLSLSFVESQEPTVANGWAGAVSGEPAAWDDGENWGAGKPDLTSIATFGSTESSVSASVDVGSSATLAGALSFAANRDYVLTGLGSIYLADTGYDTFISVAAGHQTIEVPVTAMRNLGVTVAAGASLDLEGPVSVRAGALRINTDYSTGGVTLSGAPSRALDGIYFGGGMLTMASASVFDGFGQRALFDFQGYATLRVNGEPTDAEYRLPFDLYMHSRNWGTPEVIWNDCPLVFQPYRVAMNSGASPIKRGKGRLVFESGSNQSIRLTNVNGRRGSVDSTTLPDNALKIPDDTGVLSWDYSFAGLNVLEGEVCLRGTDAAAPGSASQAFDLTHLNLVGVRSTNDVVAAPGLVLDHAWGLANNGSGSRTVVAGNAYSGECLNEATNAYLAVLNGSTLDAGTLEVGIVSDATKDAVDVRPRVTVSNSVCSVAQTLVLSGRAGCEATWNVTDGALYAGTSAIAWNGAVDGVVRGASVLARNAAGDPTSFAAGATASGELCFADGAVCRASGSTAAEGAAASVAFDGGRLDVADGTTLAFAAGCGLCAKEGGLLADVPAGETWTLASSVGGPGAVMLRGEGTLALSGTISAAFAGNGRISGGALANAELRPTIDEEGNVTETQLLDGVALTGKVVVNFCHGAENPIDASSLVGKTVVRYAGAVPDVARLRLTGVNGGKVYGKFAADGGSIVLTDVADSIGAVLIVR